MRATSTIRAAAAALATVCISAGVATACVDEGAGPVTTTTSPSTSSSGPGSTPTTAAETARLAEAACAGQPADIVADAGRPIADPDVTEASGIAISPEADGTVWMHNDSGDVPRLFSVTDNDKVTRHEVPGAEAVDWEDMAIGPDGRLYVGDIGDNGLDRPSVVIYRVTPPDPASSDPVTDVARLTLTYPDEPHNAEALLIDPVDGRIMVIAKGGGQAGVFSTPLDFEDGDEAQFERVAKVDTGEEGQAGQITGGDMSADGGVILVRTYAGALLFRRPPGTSIKEAFSVKGCPIPVGDEAQGEAIALTGDGGYVTIGEGAAPTLTPFAPAP